MSDISLNVAPSPELLKPAAGPSDVPGRIRPDAAGASNPFAALLSGVLAGAQGGPPPPASGALPLADTTPFELNPLPDAAPASGTLLALPGIAAPPPALPGDLPDGSSGNPLPVPGSTLPPGLPTADAAGAVRLDAAPDITGDAAAEPSLPTVEASRPRTSLADLALSRPLDTAPALPVPGAGDVDAARAAAAATLAGRAMPAAGSKRPDDATAPSANLTRFLDQAPGTTSMAYGTPDGIVPGADLALRLRSADLARIPGLPAGGPDFLTAQLGASLAGQLAAFAGSSDLGGTSPGTAAATGGTAAPDGGSSALLSRLGSTTLPPLQPLGDAGSFAGGLADRLLTVGGPGTHTARLKLHPENLGELDVEITMDDGTAQVWFGTTTSQARDAIEGSLPRLRELFADQGIDLTRTQIDAGGGQSGNSGFGQERRMTGGAGAWNDVPAWQPGRTVGAEPAGRTSAGTSARLLDVWA